MAHDADGWVPTAAAGRITRSRAREPGRVAIANRRLIAVEEAGVSFRYEDCRRNGADRQTIMTLAADAFIRRFLLDVLPKGFHRIRHYGLLASAGRKANIARARTLLAVPPSAQTEEAGRPLPRRNFHRRAAAMKILVARQDRADRAAEPLRQVEPQAVAQ